MEDDSELAQMLKHLRSSEAFLREAITWLNKDGQDAELYCLRALLRFHNCLGVVHAGLERVLARRAQRGHITV